MNAKPLTQPEPFLHIPEAVAKEAQDFHRTLTDPALAPIFPEPGDIAGWKKVQAFVETGAKARSDAIVVRYVFWRASVRSFVLCLAASAVLPSLSQAQSPSEVPVFEITPVSSTIEFDVKASVAIKGTFDKWDATLTFTSADVTTGVLDIKIQADSVDTGSGMKNGKLNGKDFFDTKQNPLITFKSTKIVQTGPENFEADGDFTIEELPSPRS
jgi:polyisoprenoid-binding protein YceI